MHPTAVFRLIANLRGMTRNVEAMIKQGSAIDEAIGPVKMAGRLTRPPKGALSEALQTEVSGGEP
jgi:hypothetical protein